MVHQIPPSQSQLFYASHLGQYLSLWHRLSIDSVQP
nr:MAG TPA: hypothetical protein [Caudoviricetes sp.]